MKSATTLAALVAHCHKLARRQRTPDAELLRRFAGQRDAAAFEELLERYAPLVWSVCRRMLSSEADCEDAFQATFLVLVRRADSIDTSRSLGAWLHTVAVHVSYKARTRALRQPRQTLTVEPATCGDVADELGNRELFRIVDEEIARLPGLLRAPFVLCCLEGRTRDEAAAALGCSVSAIKSRLERSRELLRHSLERRGFGLPAAFLVLGLTGGPVRAALRAKALQSILGSAPPAVAALLPAAGVSLARKLTLTAVSLVIAGVLGFGAFRTGPTEPPQDNPAPKTLQSPAAEKSGPRLDRFGDPLPPGAVRRFGTLRFRHEYAMLYLDFTPDSKQLIAGLGCSPLAVFDVASGRRLRTIGDSTGGNWYGFAISPDGKRVVRSVTGTLYDLQTGKLIRQLHDGGGQWSSVAFSPDGKVVAAAREHQAEIILVEVETGKLLARQVFKLGRAWPPQYGVEALTFSPDGNYLAARYIEYKEIKNGIMPQLHKLWLLDAHKGTLVRTVATDIATVEDVPRSFAFQPGLGRLAMNDKDGAIHFSDVETGKEVHRIAAIKKEESGGILRFLDGGRKCVITSFTRKKDHSPDTNFLTIVDVKDGKELRRLKLGENGWPVALSPDGRTAATTKFQRESCVRVWDVETGAERLGDVGHRAPATLSLSADGRTLISRGGEGRVIHWDLRTGNGKVESDKHPKNNPIKQTSEEWNLRGPHWRLVFHAKTSEMEARSLDDTKILRKVIWPSSAMGGAILSPDGSCLAVPLHDNDNSTLLWNPERDKEPRKVIGHPSTPPFGYYTQKLLFTHDSKSLLVGLCTHNPSPPSTLWIWDVATAKIVRKLPIKFAPDHLLLSRDDCFLIVASSWEDPTVHIWDMETGLEKTRVTDPLLSPMTPGKYEMARYVSHLRLTADERFLAVVTHRGDSTGISIWDTAAWKTVRSFPWTRLQNQPHSLLFSRDGRSLFVANRDTTILEVDVSGRFGETEKRNRDRLNLLWRALTETPDKAYPAVWEMLDRAAESVPFLIGKLAPVQVIDERRVRQLLPKLDAESFAEREEANRQLLALGEQIVPLLRQALKDHLSLEARKRVEGLIESLTREPALDQLRLLRALAVLEWSNRPEAVEHLRRLAGGAPSASLTQAAKAAQQRLSKKSLGGL